MSDGGEVTALLRRWCAGESDALDSIYQILGRDLQSIAHYQLRRSIRGIDLCTLELVDEVLGRFMQLANDRRLSFENRKHFVSRFAILAKHSYFDEIRRRLADKRGGGDQHLPSEDGDFVDDRLVRFWSLYEALNRLETYHEPAHTVFVYSECTGLAMQEVADCLGVSRQTATEYKKIARRFLAEEIGKIDPSALPQFVVAEKKDR
jgi:DNA-directed RNA polymerase specialized sigma24 family protein